MSSIERLKCLENHKKEIKSQIEELDNWRSDCYQDLKTENRSDRRRQINTQINGYSTEIEELFDKLDNVQKQIEELNFTSSTTKKINRAELSLNNLLDNPKNQQELKFDECLCQIDFKQAMEIFNKIQEQFDDDGDVALFFLEEYLIKRGDLCLIRFRDTIKSEQYGTQFSHWQFEYNFSDFELLINRIAEKNGIKKQDVNIQLLVDKIGDSLQNDSTLFIEIHCKIYDEDEIKHFLGRYIQDFWQPLRQKVKKVTEEFEGIKVITIVKFNQQNISLSKSLSCYFNQQNEHDCFFRDKFVKIPLEYWTKNDIFEWLKSINRSLKKSERQKIADRIYEDTQGFPNTFEYALQQEKQNLIALPNSC